MSSETTTSELTAIVPAIWSARIQVNLTKSLVALDVCNTELVKQLQVGDVFHKGYIAALTSVAYTPGTPLTAQSFSAVDDTLTVDTKRAVIFYVDDMQTLQVKPDYVTELIEDASYQLRDDIDTSALAWVTAGQAFMGNSAGTIFGLTAAEISSTITATSGNIDDVFVQCRSALRQNNVKEAGDWIAIMHPEIAAFIELNAISGGFNVADSTLRNGYAGDYLGFHIYISNNLPSKRMYVGKKGCIDLVIQQAPKVEIKSVQDKIGSNFIIWTLYGEEVFERNTDRFLNVSIDHV